MDLNVDVEAGDTIAIKLYHAVSQNLSMGKISGQLIYSQKMFPDKLFISGSHKQ